MLNRLNKMIVGLVVLVGIILIIPMKSTHAADYVVAPQLATGYYHSSVLLSDGTVWAWGRNVKGQLSYDEGAYSTWPLLIRNLDHVKLIATSIMSNYAIKEDGTLWAWGLNENGQLGDGTLENRTAPVQVSGISGVTAVSTGLGYHVLALKSDGTVWAWGRNDNGELGDGTTTQRQLPVEVAGLTDVVALVNAGYHSLAMKSDGTVWAWGRNSYGESGGGVSADRTTPFQVSISGVKAIAAGDHHSIAVKEDGTVWAWGRNTYGTLGDGTTTNRVVPVQVIGIDHVKTVVGGTHFNYALKEDGTVWSWGYNNYGQLGDGTTATKLSPVQVSDLTDVVSIAAGGYNGTAMQSGGEVWAWGYNGYGELGDKSRESRSVPVRNAAILDLTPPTIADPVIIPTDITETGVTLSWEKATDNLSKQEELEYQVYQISSLTEITVSAIEADGIRIGDYEVDMDSKQVIGLYDGQTYNYSVIVKDKDGRKSVYNKVTIITIEIPTYSVTYHTNGGAGSVPMDNNVYDQGELVSVLESGDLTRSGYTFAGWNTQADGNGTTYMAGATFSIGEVNVELYARWIADSTDSSSEGNSDSHSTIPSPGGDTGNSLEEFTGLSVTVNGLAQELVGHVSITKEDEQVLMTVYMDTDKLKAQLEKEGEKPEIIISVTQNMDKVSVVLTGNAIKGMENKQSMLIVQTLNGNYKLPMEEIMLDSWTVPFGEQVPIADMVFHINIAKSGAAQIALLNSIANEEGFIVIGPPVEFTITISYNDKLIEVSKFNSYVEREISLPHGVGSSHITTAVRMEADGTIRHVPTRFRTQEGKVIAVVSSLTNSTYLLIGNPIRFADVESHWAKDAVNDMGSRRVVRGVDESHYNPNASITRAEFASILVRALGLADTMKTNAFTDVKTGAWYNGLVTTAVEYGIIEGYADGKFRPTHTITREEAIVMIYRAMKLVGLDTNFSSKDIESTLSTFVDGSAVHSWAERAVVATVTSQLIQGSNSKLMLERDISRAETAIIIQRMLYKANLIDPINPQ
jgi:uncharacterized repeat protein (TIGR02543 family)